MTNDEQNKQQQSARIAGMYFWLFYVKMASQAGLVEKETYERLKREVELAEQRAVPGVKQ